MYKPGQLVTINDSLCRIVENGSLQICSTCDFIDEDIESAECIFCSNKLPTDYRLKLVTKLKRK